MTKYKIARGLAWLLIASGALVTALFIAVLLTTIFSVGFTPLAGTHLRGLVIGIGIVATGFICHAIFDTAEAYLLSIRSRGAD